MTVDVIKLRLLLRCTCSCFPTNVRVHALNLALWSRN